MSWMMAVQGAQALASFAEKKAEATRKDNEYKKNRLAANVARNLEIGALNTRLIQESEVIADDKLTLKIKALETRESQVVSAGEAGVSGKSVQQQLDLTEARKLRGITKYNATIDNLLTQGELEAAGIDAKAMSRINSYQRGVQPSLGKAVIGFAANAMASDITHGDGKMFGVDLIGDKNIAAMTKFGIADNEKPVTDFIEPFSLILNN
tara:strand:- start:1047 stop:1673 length:627 start_codon:yes stop_codon:yes gene_type:complete